MRQPLSALAYLDIGDDNGGIVLNLSEDGLGLQAVAPLDGQKQVRLRIQLPQLETRIETAAEIVWLGTANRQAGVRFLNLPAVARVQIREWIKSQAVPGLTSRGGATVLVPEDTVGATRLEDAVPGQDSPSSDVQLAPDNSRAEKWLSLMAEFENKISAQEASQLRPATAPEPAVPPPPATLHQGPEIVSRRFGDYAPTVAVEPGGDPQSYVPLAQPTAALGDILTARQPTSEESGSLSFLRNSAKAPEETADQPYSIGSAPDSPVTNPRPVAPAFRSQYGFTRDADRGTIPPASSTDSTPGIAPASRGKRARNQAAAVAAFALFSILCFGIGTQVGHFADGKLPQPPAPAPPSPPSLANLEVTAEANTRPPTAQPRVNAARQANDVSRATAQRVFHKSSAPGGRVASLKSQPIAPLGPAASAEVAQPAPQASSSWTNQGAQTTPGAAALVPSADSTTGSPNPRVVDGYVLQPSDRFNPCHLTYRVDPVYPPQAQQQGIEGTVKIHLIIAADGSVQSETLIGGPPALVPAAMDAAKYWRYLPALLNGEPIPIEQDIEIAFRLPR